VSASFKEKFEKEAQAGPSSTPQKKRGLSSIEAQAEARSKNEKNEKIIWVYLTI
tara:strand:- start:71 stop:232 length:162 start_codon:yes stop_codon:yes gene_type:complete